MVQVAFAIACLAMSGRCAYRVWQTFRLEINHESGNSKRFFGVWFYWFWGVLRIAWSLTWFLTAIAVLKSWSWALGTLMLLPASMAFGMLLCWTLMPYLLRRFHKLHG